MFTDVFTDPELEVNEHNVIRRLENFPCSKWEDLGLVLKVPYNKRDEIRANNPGNVSRCFLEVIIYWLRNSKVSWKVLWEALCERSVAEENLGHEIQDWYTRKIWNDPRQVSHLSTCKCDLLREKETNHVGLLKLSLSVVWMDMCTLQLMIKVSREMFEDIMSQYKFIFSNRKQMRILISSITMCRAERCST